MEETILDNLDYQILQLVANNARISFLEVARICNVSGASIHQRIQKMTNSGIITGSEFSLNLHRLGYITCAYVRLYFNDSINIDNVIERIKNIHQIVECHQTTDISELFVKIYAQNNTELHEIIHNRIKPLGLIRSEAIMTCNESFRRQLTFTKL